MTNDRHHLEQVLLGKLMNKSEYYYDNHTLLSPDLFREDMHKEIFLIIDKQYQSIGKVDMSDFYSKSKDKHNSLTVASSCNDKAFEPYSADKLILLLNEWNRKEKLEVLCLNTVNKIKNGDDLFELLDDVEKKL